MITDTLSRTSGRTSAASVPSDRLHEHDLVDAREARDHLRDPRCPWRATLAVEVGEQLDFRAVLEAAQRIDARIERLVARRGRATLLLPAPCVRAMPRAASTASSRAASSSWSEYAKPVRSPEIARTPMP